MAVWQIRSHYLGYLSFIENQNIQYRDNDSNYYTAIKYATIFKIDRRSLSFEIQRLIIK